MLRSTNRRSAAAQSQTLAMAEGLFRRSPDLAHVTTGRCPACGSRHPVAPILSRHLPPRTVEHDWQCDSCDHLWTTVVTMGSPPIAPGQNHRFAVGSAVRLTGRAGLGVSRGHLFEILALRPAESGDVHYRIKSAAESFERIARESDLSAVQARH